MELKRLTDPASPLFAPAMELYGISFPVHEQRLDASQRRILGDEAYHFDLLWAEGAFAVLILYWEQPDYFYVEHFCVLPQLRGMGFGSRALELLQAKGKPVILEIDPPRDEVSRRRKGFYERCGFAENPFAHLHPPYRRGAAGHDLVVMSSPAPLTAEEYGRFAAFLKGHVMADVFD